MSDLCYCGNPEEFDKCCGIYLSGAEWPSTPEKCMRARYSAYVTHNINFIKETQSPEHRSSINWEDTKKWSEDSDWKSLEIVNSHDNVVEFKAHYELNGKPICHHERSNFIQVDGRWYFDDGQIVQETFQRHGEKIGRNDPCPCGSGKKYKKCCLNK